MNRTVNDSGYGHTRTPSAQAYNTLPAASSNQADDSSYGGYGLGRPGNGLVDEFGSNAPSRPVISAAPGSIGAVATPSATLASTAGRSTGTSTTANRFMVKNAEVPQDTVNRQRSAQAQAQGSGSGSGSAAQPPKQWPTAEEEKHLYEQARAKVAHTQGVAAAPVRRL